MGAPDSMDHELQSATATCNLSLGEHIELAMTALTVFGLGIACETEYQALLVIAETARLLHGHSGFDPRAEAEKLAQRAREVYAEAAIQRAKMEQIEAVLMTAGGPVH